ncbi:MAG TPA: biopolymer transporter ExbD [Burkholderiaceae bacterium]|nr:biopolymer transporter ExbD [Burkholderiaceae bacterium]
MNFRRHRQTEEPEINLIPFIDILLVIIIFLVVTTTYSRFTELKITLPTADAEKPVDRPKQVQVAVTADGRYAVNNRLLPSREVTALAAEMQRAGGTTDPVIIINADASASHQSVISVLEAARVAGYGRITFATQKVSGAR